jgi:hypothetical protein
MNDDRQSAYWPADGGLQQPASFAGANVQVDIDGT